MRKLKFRVWDNLKKAWVTNKRIHTINTDGTGYGYLQHPDGFAIEQFIGLKDKNGKEIYEGDIVNQGPAFSDYNRAKAAYPELADELIKDRVGVVEMIGTQWAMTPLCGYFKKEHRGIIYFSFGFKPSEVIIGNIHENPELLK